LTTKHLPHPITAGWIALLGGGVTIFYFIWVILVVVFRRQSNAIDGGKEFWLVARKFRKRFDFDLLPPLTRANSLALLLLTVTYLPLANVLVRNLVAEESNGQIVFRVDPTTRYPYPPLKNTFYPSLCPPPPPHLNSRTRSVNEMPAIMWISIFFALAYMLAIPIYLAYLIHRVRRPTPPLCDCAGRGRGRPEQGDGCDLQRDCGVGEKEGGGLEGHC
jgi:hypothetical protein